MAKNADNKRVLQYGTWWEPLTPQLFREMECIRRGGKWKKPDGSMAGEGLFQHFKNALQLIWPEIVWHKWVDMFVENFLTKRTVCVLGPSSTGKTFCAAVCVLLDYYCYPSKTTVICCSTTIERLEDRIWGEVKRLHKLAQSRHDFLPGHLIPYRRRIVSSDKEEWTNDGDFRNGLVGVPCQSKTNYIGLGDFAGIKNKRVILLGDELSLLPKVFVDAISNLDANPKFLCIALGNPKDTTDALGVLAEPAAKYGGWDGAIDRMPGSKTWDTRRMDGVCLQWRGSDSPNLSGTFGADLLTQSKIDRDVAFYGKDSLQYTMFNEGEMPHGQGSRRVLTRQECEKHGARDLPFWASPNRTQVAHLDAAYGGVGGDRCVLMFSEFGEELESSPSATEVLQAIVSPPDPRKPKRQIFALKDTMLVPIKNDPMLSAPDQIAAFCKSECEKRGVLPKNFIFDAGMRTALVQSFSRLWSVHVQSIDSMGKPTGRPVSYDQDTACDKFYKNFVTEMWWSVRLMVLAGQMRNMSTEVIEEFAAREWGLVGANLTQVETKEDMKQKLGRSPDLADCFVYGVELARRLGFTIRRLKPAKEPKEDNRWKQTVMEQGRAYWGAGQLPMPAAR